MKNIWFISDTHFSHENILTFKGEDEQFIRPGFANAEELDEFMVEQWNSHVQQGDKVYHLGDVFMGKSKEALNGLLARLHGSKRLLVGNHDDRMMKALMPHFAKVGLWRIFKEEGFVCSHIPLMPSQFRSKVVLNVHGHIHERQMADQTTYLNVCVEQTGYRPLHMDEICARVASVAK